MRLSPGIGETDFAFTGQRALSAIGLMDYRSRFYASGLGRFTQADSFMPDPSNPQAFNRYSYVINRPTSYVDPTGHLFVEESGDDCGWGTTDSLTKKCTGWVAPDYYDYGDNEYDNPKHGRALPATEAVESVVKAIETVVSVVAEPADWAFTINRWRKGEFSAWDIAGLLPFFSSSMGHGIESALTSGPVRNHIDDIIDWVRHEDDYITILGKTEDLEDYLDTFGREGTNILYAVTGWKPHLNKAWLELSVDQGDVLILSSLEDVKNYSGIFRSEYYWLQEFGFDFGP